MSKKHTPGPWRLSETARDAVVCDSDSGHDKPDAVTYYGGHLIAESVFTNANRALIAAAPDLLAALQGLDEAFCRAGTPLTRNERTEDRKRLIAARAAIAKATGATA